MLIDEETTPHKNKMSKVKFFIIGATSIAILVGGIFLGKVFSGESETNLKK